MNAFESYDLYKDSPVVNHRGMIVVVVMLGHPRPLSAYFNGLPFQNLADIPNIIFDVSEVLIQNAFISDSIVRLVTGS